MGRVVSDGSFDLAGVKRAERVRLVEIWGSPEAGGAPAPASLLKLLSTPGLVG